MTTIINEHNLITVGKEKLYSVKTPISLSLIGEDEYPIFDEHGELYSLNEDEMSVRFEESYDKIAMRINGEVYYIPTSEYQFEVSENEQTAFLNMILEFKLHAENEEDAYYKLNDILCDEKNVIADFVIYDINRDEYYSTDILLIQYSGMYNAKEIDLGIALLD